MLNIYSTYFLHIVPCARDAQSIQQTVLQSEREATVSSRVRAGLCCYQYIALSLSHSQIPENRNYRQPARALDRRVYQDTVVGKRT